MPSGYLKRTLHSLNKCGPLLPAALCWLHAGTGSMNRRPPPGSGAVQEGVLARTTPNQLVCQAAGQQAVRAVQLPDSSPQCDVTRCQHGAGLLWRLLTAGPLQTRLRCSSAHTSEFRTHTACLAAVPGQQHAASWQRACQPLAGSDTGHNAAIPCAGGLQGSPP